MNVFNIIIPIAYAIVACSLIWFICELAVTVRKARKTIAELKAEIDPTVANVNEMIDTLQPTLGKVDPLVDRVTLTVDSVNLELMRVDGILEDVSKITSGVSKTVGAVDTVTSAPLDIVTNVTKKVRERFKPKYASDESVDLGSANVQKQPVNPIVDFVDTAGSVAEQTIHEEAQAYARRRDEEQAQTLQRQARTQKMDVSSTRIVNDVLGNVDADSNTY